MKVGNTRIFIENFQNQQGENANKNRILNFFNGNNKNSQDKVAQKRKEAREQAMKMVKDAFYAEKSIDDDLAERAGRCEDAKANILEASKKIGELDNEKEKLKETYGITDDSQEQQDLKLLEKRRESMKPNSTVTLTEEETKRLAEIDERGMTEYQKASLEIDSWKAPYNKTIEEAKKTIQEENSVIIQTGLARLEHAPMVEAAQQASAIMEAANKEIIGMVVEEAKNNVDEKMDEIKEEMKESKEEKEELDEQIEEIQEKNEEMEAAYQAKREEHKKYKTEILDIPTDQILQLNEAKSDVQQEVNNMLIDMKLLAEDIKGSVVDIDM